MNILVPLNDHLYIEELIEAGADEFYCGFYDEEWTSSLDADINRMSGFGKRANQYSFRQVLKIADEVHAFGKKVYITLNAEVYNKRALDFIEKKYFHEMSVHKIDGVIVSDISVATAAIRHDLTPVASTMMTVYNHDIAKYLYSMGIHRQILPRDLTMYEIEKICAACPEIKFEMFFMENGCVFSDGFCLGTHKLPAGSTCGFLKRAPKRILSDDLKFRGLSSFYENRDYYCSKFHKHACAQCALYRAKKAGITALKIVGRANNPEGIIDVIKLTKENIEISQRSNNEEEYLAKMILPKPEYEYCANGMSCYYPEIRFGNN